MSVRSHCISRVDCPLGPTVQGGWVVHLVPLYKETGLSVRSNCLYKETGLSVRSHCLYKEAGLSIRSHCLYKEAGLSVRSHCTRRLGYP